MAAKSKKNGITKAAARMASTVSGTGRGKTSAKAPAAKAQSAKAQRPQQEKPKEEQKVFISDADCYLFGQGTHYDIYKKLGAHPSVEDGREGMFFAVWAPFGALHRRP